MKTKSLWMTAAAVFFMAAFLSGCKKDTFVATVGVCPLVVSTDPANLATGVPLNKIITATFNEPMNPVTITPTSFTLQGPAKGTASEISGTLTYNALDTTMRFTPTNKLTAGTYTATVKSSVKDLAGNSLQADYVWTFSTSATISPTVISTDPANNATDVVLNKIVTATFSVPMDPLTLTTTTFTIKQGTTPITGTVSYTGTTATFKPSANLLSGTTYTATITTGAKNVPGTAMVNDYVWIFSTGTITAPTVISTDPLNLATGVALNKVINAVFSMAMDPSTITTSSYTLMIGTTPVAGTVSYLGTTTTASFKPSANLLPGTIYTATITTGAKNVPGTAMVNNYVWTFTTGTITAPAVISTDPLNNATGVALNKVIDAVFSMPMDPLTITTSSYTLMIGTTPVAGTVSYLGTTASFTPTGGLLTGNTYTATITTVAKNPAGIPIANDYVWSFSTGAAAGPMGVDLKSVARFGIIAGLGVSNNAGFSEIHDLDVGISPGPRTGIVGFPPGIIVNGAIYASDDIAPAGVPAMLTQAQQDLTDAYLFAANATAPAPTIIAGDQGGKTLAPGLYKSTSTLSIQLGNLTLDAQGDANAVWIFQIASDFTTFGGGPFPSPTGGNVILAGNAQAKNVFWQVTSSAIIGDYTSFKGTILALTSITMGPYAKAEGRMLARNGSVVLTSTNIITKP